MKNLLYLLCVLTLMSCSKKDDDNIALTDYEKPLSSKSSAELKQIIQTNLDLSYQMQRDFSTLMSNEIGAIYDAMEHYGVDINLFPGIMNFSSSPTRTSPAPHFVGMTCTWNPNKAIPGFDKTISANGKVIEYYFPSSIEDDSKNDLHIAINLHVKADSYQREIFISQNETLKVKASDLESDNEFIQNIDMGPYTCSRKMNMRSNKFFPMQALREYKLKKEGGSSYSLNTQIIGSDMELITDYNNIRVRASINEYASILELMESMMDKIEDEDFNNLTLELINKNMQSAVLVFNDRDEKIGNLSMVNNESLFGRDWMCHFADGEQFRFSILPIFLGE